MPDISKDETAGNRGKVRKPTGDPRYFAAFICAIGFSFLVVALYSLFWLGSDISKVSPWLAWTVIGMSAGSVICFFAAINIGSWPIRDVSLSAIINWLLRAFAPWPIALLATLLAIGAIILANNAITDARNDANLTASQFALSIPVDVVEQENGDSTVQREATIFWGVPAAERTADDGIVKMLLAAFLTIAFGVIYPFVVRGGREQEMGMLQKLVVPILGAILFGVGATEQASAETRRQDVRLAAQGLPPVLEIRERQRDIFVLREDEMSLAARIQLNTAIGELVQELNRMRRETGSPEDPGLGDLRKDLWEIQRELRDGGRISRTQAAALSELLRKRLEAGFRSNNDATRAIASQMANDSRALSVQLKAMEENERAIACTYIQSQLALAKERTETLIRIVERDDQRAERHVLDSLWVGITGEDKSDSERWRTRLGEQGEITIQELESGVQECGPTL